MSVEQHFQESIDSFSISFGGKSSIDADIFSNTIDETIILVKESLKAIDPNAFVRLEIKANKEGSFITCIDAITRYVKDILTPENVEIATGTIGGLYTFLKIKKHLKGKKPKKIVQEKEQDTFVNFQNESLLVDKKFSQAYLKNSQIDNSITKIIMNIQLGDRESFSLKHKDFDISLKRDDFEHMSKSIFEGKDEIPSTTESQTIESCELRIKKPDLLGNSKWELVFDKIIQASIADEDFLKKIKSGEIKISGGTKIVCSMEIIREMNENFEPINCRYIIKKVEKIIDKDDQLNLYFE